MIAFDTASKTALWLRRAWPKFADPHASEMPVPMYGQTFLCLSLEIATASKIAEQMGNHQVAKKAVTRKARAKARKANRPDHFASQDDVPISPMLRSTLCAVTSS